MRLFVAVNPPSQMRRDLATRLDKVRSQVPIAWTSHGGWHLTLMFLGEWEPARLPMLAEALRGTVAGHASFSVRPGRFGAFPDLRRPRVLFLQLDGGEPLQRLAAGVRRAVDTVWPDGPQDRRAFRPHLTLARLRDPLSGRPLAILRNLDLGAWEPFAVQEVRLLSSELRRGGARYTTQATVKLGG